MKKLLVYFTASFLLFLQLKQVESTSLLYYQSIICYVLIGTIGVSHGAIDNLLYSVKARMSTLRFIRNYLIAFALNVFIWLLAPSVAFFLFLLISAYHFGQSQFVDFKQLRPALAPLLYWSWGVLLILGLVFFNQTELSDLSAEMFDNLIFSTLLINLSPYGFYISLIVTVALFTFAFATAQITLEQVIIELIVIFLIHLSFYLFSPLLGFTLYFIIFHSWRVIKQEFQFTQRSKLAVGKLDFVKKLLPFTLLSLGGMGLVLIGYFVWQPNISLVFLAFVMISSITLPHAYVMNVFYNRKKSN